ncbi:MAG: diaminopimelate epimerase [Alphaproteobacteria bacterium]
MQPVAPAPFLKMHGLGNDFVVLDGRRHGWTVTPALARALADRRTGIGCDQVILLTAGAEAALDAAMAIWNADGSTAEACGNAARCLVGLLLDESGADLVRLDTPSGPVSGWRAAADLAGPGRNDTGDWISVDMGPVRTDWRDIPVASPCDTLHMPVSGGPLSDPVGVNVGNPHAVFFVPDAEVVDLATLGPQIERDPFFPRRVNVEVVSLLDTRTLRMRVWERGAGITRACGTGACAALVAAHRRGLVDRPAARLRLDGGDLHIAWRDDNHVVMSGPARTAFRGTVSPALLAAAADTAGPVAGA